MTFEQFHNKHPEYSYMVAKIHYNEYLKQNLKENKLILNFTVDSNYESCENCSA